ncbi:hypothetical protein BT69DRAFT_1290582 [Atractiella rhizophila]|nr:hypothetical protein BT69DRAFT_1290582 [Atractiella rhizophila]
MAPPTSIAQTAPPEVLSNIFEHISLQLRPEVSFSLHCSPRFTSLLPSPPDLQSTFSSLSRVCSQWRGPAMRELLVDLCLERDGQIMKVVHGLVRTEGREWLAMVRHLRVGWNRQPAIPVDDPDLVLLPELIRGLPNLKYVTLGGEQYDLTSFQLEESLLQCRELVGLDCENILLPYYDNVHFGPQGRRSGETISRLLLACPKLQQVRFDDFRSLYHSLLSLPPSYSSTTVLRSLALRRVVLESDGLMKLLLPLKGVLKELFLSRSSLGATDTFRSVMTSVGAGGLQTLEITECEVWASWTTGEASLIDCLLSLPYVESVSILGPLGLSTPTFEDISGTLQRFTIGSSSVRAEEMVAALKRGWNPKELRVEVGGLRCKWTVEQERELQKICEEKNVHFICKNLNWTPVTPS